MQDISHIDWSYLSKGNPTNIHGDLQFDNIILGKNNKIKLIDWRPNFGKFNLIGDINYDLAKLLGGLEINYDLIKKNKFYFRKKKNKISIKVPKRNGTKKLIKVLENFIIEKKLDIEKIKVITGLIFLNMSPLHHHPFDKLLFYFGKYYLK